MKTWILFAALLTATAAGAQTRPTSVKFNKANTPAIQLQVPYSEEIAEGAIIQKLKEIGYEPETSGALLWKKNTVDGYYVFKNVSLRDLDGKPVDLYFKVAQPSRKEKSKADIYMLVSNGLDQFYSSETDPKVYESANRFLSGFQDYSASYKLDVDIQASEEAVKAAEKKYSKLKDDEKDLEEKLRNNRKQQEAQLKAINDERAKLEELRRKKLPAL
ncbi:hypothetical protein [Paracnuella aquatica]|uniref:hypothetical protein n=1 Tax=Paracnuella aquatica TaxID=2268757 RepID=UPI000DEF4A7C|nr:hypothetical protein [Paracnuella aquatica]RPD50866.1 hypothetical protein DRJ53_05065 [Paracnuella aquatica]